MLPPLRRLLRRSAPTTPPPAPAPRTTAGPDDVPFPSGGPPTHWDQAIRYLPVPLRVRTGQRIQVVARHTDASLQIGVRGVVRDWLGAVGHVDSVLSNRRLSVGAATSGCTVHLAPEAVPPPHSRRKAREAIQEALRAVLAIEDLGRRVVFSPALAILTILGPASGSNDPLGSGLSEDTRRLYHSLSALVSTFSRDALHAALRVLLVPQETIVELAQASLGARWLLARTVYCLHLFTSDVRIRRETVLMLRDKMKLYRREEWADCFGLPFWESFPVHTAWGVPEHLSKALMSRVLGANGSTASLSLLELLTLGKAMDVPEVRRACEGAHPPPLLMSHAHVRERASHSIAAYRCLTPLRCPLNHPPSAPQTHLPAATPPNAPSAPKPPSTRTTPPLGVGAGVHFAQLSPVPRRATAAQHVCIGRTPRRRAGRAPLPRSCKRWSIPPKRSPSSQRRPSQPTWHAAPPSSARTACAARLSRSAPVTVASRTF